MVIAKSTECIPRNVNNVCFNALDGLHAGVDSEVVDEVIIEPSSKSAAIDPPYPASRTSRVLQPPQSMARRFRLTPRPPLTCSKLP
jgi:hypothetical protein